MKAIFFDRDGVLINNSKHYYISQVKDVEFVDGVFENLKLLKSEGFIFFIVSNQGGIARKQYGHREVKQVHQYLKNEFEKHNIAFKDIYYCPHHDTVEACICRKPSSLMIEKLMAKYEIIPENALFIGDQETDMQAAKSAGIKGIKISPNQNMSSFIQELLTP